VRWFVYFDRDGGELRWAKRHYELVSVSVSVESWTVRSILWRGIGVWEEKSGGRGSQ